MNIEVFGAGDRTRVASRILKDAAPRSGLGIERIKLFGIPTSRDGVYITGTDIPLSGVIETAKRGDYLVGYGFGEAARASLDSRGIKYYDASLDEDFLTENAYITAVGTLCYLFGSEARIPADLKIGIIGYGRIGKELLRMLLFFKSELTVFSSSAATRIELGRVGIASHESTTSGLSPERLGKLDLLINTAPCELSGIFKEGRVPEGLRALDLASGDSFRGIAGIERLPALPDRMYPHSSGVSYARHALAAIG